MRGLEKVRAEMELLMLSYNFKRVLNIIGIGTFREFCLQRRLKDALFFFLTRLIVMIRALRERLGENKCIKSYRSMDFCYSHHRLQS